MIALTGAACFTPCLDRVHGRFQALLPRIEQPVNALFRHVRCPHRREVCEAEALPLWPRSGLHAFALAAIPLFFASSSSVKE
ncbi:MAG: hypothetical protein U0840_11010 [Gemmataceae bacterium]